ncbi:hypothetical protein BH10PLA2_BH10PLA2_25350 [soil metagenome]
MGTIPVFNIVTDYGAVGSGSTADAATNTNAFLSAISAAAGGGIIFVPPSAGGFVVNNGVIVITSPNITIAGAGSMGSAGNLSTPQGIGGSTIIGFGPGTITNRDTITINQVGCTIENLAFLPIGTQSGSYLSITGTDCWVKNVHMQSPNIGISLTTPVTALGQFWIEDLQIAGSPIIGGIHAEIGECTLYLSHVIMGIDLSLVPLPTQPAYGVAVTCAGEVLICNGTDIAFMGTCLELVPNNTQSVVATFISDSFFDSGNGPACLYIAPSGTGYVSTVHLSSVWTSTGHNAGLPTSGFKFLGSGGTGVMPGTIENVTMVNCLAKGFNNGQSGLYAAGVNGLSVTSSTFGANGNGIVIAPGMNNFILNGNKCGKYVPNNSGGNDFFGIVVGSGCDKFIVANNLCYGNVFGGRTIAPGITYIDINNIP